MKKILLGLVAASFSMSVVAAELTTECENYFKEADAMLTASATEMKAQGVDVDTVKAQFEASKAQFTALSADQQKTVCTQALEAMAQAKKAQADAAAAAK